MGVLGPGLRAEPSESVFCGTCASRSPPARELPSSDAWAAGFLAAGAGCKLIGLIHNVKHGGEREATDVTKLYRAMGAARYLRAQLRLTVNHARAHLQ